MRRHHLGFVAVAVLVAIVAGACSSDAPATHSVVGPTASVVDGRDVTASLRTIVQRAVDAHRALADSARQLADSVSPSCPSEWAQPQAAWRSARLAWDAAAVYGFAAQRDVNLHANVDHWPVDTDGVDETVEGSSPLGSDDIAALGAARKGLPAIEYVVFDERAPTPRRCSYVVFAAGEIAQRADAVADQLDADAERLAGDAGALVDTISLLADAVYAVCDAQMGMPSGNTATGAPADTGLVHQGPAKMAIKDIHAQLDEVERAYQAGVQPIVVARFRDAPDPLQAIFAQTSAALDALNPDLARAITDQPDAVAFATDQCHAVRRTFSTNVSGLLGVTIILPIGDGD